MTRLTHCNAELKSRDSEATCRLPRQKTRAPIAWARQQDGTTPIPPAPGHVPYDLHLQKGSRNGFASHVRDVEKLLDKEAATGGYLLRRLRNRCSNVNVIFLRGCDFIGDLWNLSPIPSGSALCRLVKFFPKSEAHWSKYSHFTVCIVYFAAKVQTGLIRAPS